jgi:hypothetical protein
LTAYPNFKIDMLGATFVDVQCGDCSHNLPLAVTKDDGMPLFGRDWIAAFNLHPRCDRVQLRDDMPEVAKLRRPEQAANMDVDMLLKDYADVVSDRLGKVHGYQASIQLREDAKPVVFKPRPVPFAFKKAADQEIDRLLQGNIFEPIDPITTEITWASPVVYVPKPSGQVRLCGDFKVTINPYLVYTQHPLPRFEEIATTFNGFEEFSVIDLKDAYLQLEVEPVSRKYLVISTHRGYFQYTRLPFGVASAPSLFQAYMDKLLAGIDGVACFLDDIVTGGRTRQEHLVRLRLIFTRLRQAHMTTQLAKLRLLCPEIRYVGHLFDRVGIHPLPDNVAALRDLPTPSNVKELRSFLGSINFYAKFIPNLQRRCIPLHNLLQKGSKWIWTTEHDKLFKQLKMSISSSDTLVHYNPSLPLVLCTDLSENLGTSEVFANC